MVTTSGIRLVFSPVNLDAIACVDILFAPRSMLYPVGYRQPIFMDSINRRPLTSCLRLCLEVGGPGRDGRVEDIEAKVFIPQTSL